MWFTLRTSREGHNLLLKEMTSDAFNKENESEGEQLAMECKVAI